MTSPNPVPLAARGRGIGLARRVEEPVQLLWRKADAAVSDGKMHFNLAIGATPPGSPLAASALHPFPRSRPVAHQVVNVHAEGNQLRQHVHIDGAQ